MSRVLLISYPGYPSSPAALVANAWLANAAGALLAEGHAVLAVDYGTVTAMRRLYPQALTDQLRPLAARLAGGGGAPDQAQLQMLHQVSALLEAHQAQEVAAIGDELVALAREWEPDLVALELADTDGFGESVALATALRAARPGLVIVVGGRKAAWFRERILRACPALDGALFGDPEVVLTALASGGLRPLPGLVTRAGAGAAETPRGEEARLDDLPLPVYDPEVYPAMAGDDKLQMAILAESRGCPNRCAFCVHPYEDGEVQRLMSPERLVDSMAALQARYGFSVFRFGGASTPGDMLRDVAVGLLARGLKVQYNSFGHFRTVRPEEFDLLARSGLYSLFFGLESGSQEILDRAVHKGIKLDQVRESVKAAQAAGIFTATSMIVPLPFDTPETLAESLRFVTDLRPDSVPLQFPGMFPGSRWSLNPGRYNLEVDDRDRMFDEFMGYRIKLLFPPQFWDPLPYKVNGLSFHEFTGVTIRFARDLEAAGLLTNFSHTLAALAKSAEMPPRQLRDLAMLWCVTGDAEAMGDMVQRANRNMLRGG